YDFCSMPASSRREQILALLAQPEAAQVRDERSRSAGDIARAIGISRQAAHRHLAALVREGVARAEGRGRAVKYRRAASLPLAKRYPRAVIAEDRVWSELTAAHPAIGSLRSNARSVFRYAFTEMLNNAIEHSGSRDVEVRFEAVPGGLAFEIIDQGRG